MTVKATPRELWINPLDIPTPGSFKITGALASGDNPQNGEVLFREVMSSQTTDPENVSQKQADCTNTIHTQVDALGIANEHIDALEQTVRHLKYDNERIKLFNDELLKNDAILKRLDDENKRLTEAMAEIHALWKRHEATKFLSDGSHFQIDIQIKQFFERHFALKVEGRE